MASSSFPCRYDLVIGVDFSGAVRAGNKIWITIGRPAGDALSIRAICRITTLSAGVSMRRESLAALRSFIAVSDHAIVGCDFPFGLPQALVGQGAWGDFVVSFGNQHADPASFRAWCRAASPDREAKRATDITAQAPFSPYNLRLYHQTYYGIRDVLAPLVREHRVGVAPMLPLPGTTTTLIEVCPASTLRRMGLYEVPYKGRTRDCRDARELLLESLVECGRLELGPEAPADAIVCDPEGDAIDSLVAAATAHHVAEMPQRLVTDDPVVKIEGWVYT